MFQPLHNYFKRICNTDNISAWKSKGLSEESIKLPTTSNNGLAPSLDFINDKIRVTFDGGCLIQENTTNTHKKVVNIYIVYELNSYPRSTKFTSGNSLFGAVKLTKNADPDKYRYSGYGIGFDTRGSFSLPNSIAYGRNWIIFGVDMS